MPFTIVELLDNYKIKKSIIPGINRIRILYTLSAQVRRYIPKKVEFSFVYQVNFWESDS